MFISYSWDDEIHKEWVARLAADLRTDGVETRLDQWHTVLGDQLASFMANELRDNDFVIVVCTPNYRRKSEEGKGGVGFEGNIMTADVAARGNHRKYIPVLARGTWNDAAPSWIRGKRYADLSTKQRYAANYGDVIRTLLGKAGSAPPVEKAGSSATASRASGDAPRSWGEKGASPKGGGVGLRSEMDDGQSRWAIWYGRKAMAVYALGGITIALLGLLYGPGILKPRSERNTVEAQPDADAAASVALSTAASARKPGTVFADCAACPPMIVVPTGRFMMGSPQPDVGTYFNERPMRPVAVAEPFAVGVYEVTRGEFRRFVEDSRYAGTGGCSVLDEVAEEWKQRSGNTWRNVGFEQTDSHPVSCVSWNDASEYVRWLSNRTGATYRLLSESEWEYVARGGTSTARYWRHGSDEGSHCRFANFADSRTSFFWRARCDDGHEYTAPVGSYEANAFGLHDVLGNVWEWVQDCWHEDYSGAPSDTSAWEHAGCGKRVVRGGSRYVGLRGIRSAHRSQYAPATRNQNTGFRVARAMSSRPINPELEAGDRT